MYIKNCRKPKSGIRYNNKFLAERIPCLTEWQPPARAPGGVAQPAQT
jgi:hypothetical protein